MGTPIKKELMMEFLLELLKDEREKRRMLEREVKDERENRKRLEAEVTALKTILEPLQQKEMDYYLQKKQTAIQNIRKTYHRNHSHGCGRVVCDSGMDDDEAHDFDIIDMPMHNGSHTEDDIMSGQATYNVEDHVGECGKE